MINIDVKVEIKAKSIAEQTLKEVKELFFCLTLLYND